MEKPRRWPQTWKDEPRPPREGEEPEIGSPQLVGTNLLHTSPHLAGGFSAYGDLRGTCFPLLK